MSMATAPRVCSVEGCGSDARVRGFCNKHWLRFRRHGDPTAGRLPNGVAIEFLENIVLAHKGIDCLIWPFRRSEQGYGLIPIDGRDCYVSNEVCRRIRGERPTSTHEAAHSCGKGHLGCVSPNHLSWKTKAENEADKVLHGTVLRGNLNPASKLTREDVGRIRLLIPHHTQTFLAKKFGVSRQQISRIARGERWNWLQDERIQP